MHKRTISGEFGSYTIPTKRVPRDSLGQSPFPLLIQHVESNGEAPRSGTDGTVCQDCAKATGPVSRKEAESSVGIGLKWWAVRARTATNGLKVQCSTN